jgi:hypothetical protein
MHPSEMKNSALVAAAKAKEDGFIATAEAFLFLAEVCAGEARQLTKQGSQDSLDEERDSPLGRVHPLLVSH